MSTMIVPEAAPDSPEPAYTGEGLRFVPIHANLLPDEVIAGRRVRQTQRRLLIGLGALVLLLFAWYGFATFQTHNARSHLNAAQDRTARLEQTLRGYAPLVTAQTESAQIQQSLTRLMAGDLQWSGLLTTLQNSAGGGVGITRVEGTLDAANNLPAQKGGLAVLNTSGARQVGTLTVSGYAADKNAVAAYIDGLAKVKGLAAPYPASVIAQPGQVTFSTDIIITSDALSGRYSTASAGAQGGK